MEKPNPCVGCGACCASFRVQFDRNEPVPKEYTEDLDKNFSCMKGTGRKHRPACVGLQGRIGTDAKCSIYEQRPTPCRAFKASYEDGERNPRCDEARKAHGLKPLSPFDWK